MNYNKHNFKKVIWNEEKFLYEINFDMPIKNIYLVNSDEKIIRLSIPIICKRNKQRADTYRLEELCYLEQELAIRQEFTSRKDFMVMNTLPIKLCYAIKNQSLYIFSEYKTHDEYNLLEFEFYHEIGTSSVRNRRKKIYVSDLRAIIPLTKKEVEEDLEHLIKNKDSIDYDNIKFLRENLHFLLNNEYIDIKIKE